MDFYRFYGISPHPCGPRTPWSNKQRLLSHCSNVLGFMAKSLTEEGYVDRVTIRPSDLMNVETSTPEQLSADLSEEDSTMLQLQRIALTAHQEARQALDLMQLRS